MNRPEETAECSQCQKLKEELQAKDKQIQELQTELEKLKEKVPSKSDKLQASKATAQKNSKPPHLWGRKAGHPGSYRPVPDHIDREVEQTLQTCPDCHQPLGKPADLEEHVQEDSAPRKQQVVLEMRVDPSNRLTGVGSKHLKLL